MRAHEFIAEISDEEDYYIFDRFIDDILADDIWLAFQATKKMSDNFNIPSYELRSEEADDIRQ